MQNRSTLAAILALCFYTVSDGQGDAQSTDPQGDLALELGAFSVSLTVKGLATEADESTTGPASFVVVDPDGNSILIDQHVE